MAETGENSEQHQFPTKRKMRAVNTSNGTASANTGKPESSDGAQ